MVSASGLIYKDNSLLLISDNSSILYEYNIQSSTLESYPLLQANADAAVKNIPKKIKPDFESIAVYGEDCYIFGSGSTENRNRMVHFNTARKEKIAETDLTDLYMAMQNFGNISPNEFNIEGSIYNGEKMVFSLTEAMANLEKMASSPFPEIT